MYGCILKVGNNLITQTEEGLAAYRRPKAQRFGSWCTVASFKLARVTRPRRRVSSCRGRACLVSTPTHTKKWKFGSRCCHTHWFSDFAFRAQLKGQDYVDPCELTHVATFTSRSTHAHVRLFLLCGRSTWVYCRQLYILDKHCTVRSHGFNLAHCLSRLARNPRFQGAVSWASLCPAGIAHSD